MFKLKVGLDWDDTTAPFNSIAIEMANEKYGLDLTLEDITSWENTGDASVIKEFYGDERLYEKQNYKISEKTKASVRKLMEIVDLYFITAVAPEFMGVRAMQILREFPDFPSDHIILGAAKNLVQFDIILDDNIYNVLESPSKFPVLMRKPWNASMTGLLSVNNLDEFTVLVEHIISKLAKSGSEKISKPYILALVGPSGCGKNAIAHKLVESKQYQRPLSFSTKEGSSQYPMMHMSKEAFQHCLKTGQFFEHTMYGGHYYGTIRSDIEDILESGKNAVIPLDMCGAIAMKLAFPTIIVYVKRRKADLIADILKKDIPDNEKTIRLLSLDAERKNAEICDCSIDSNELRLAQIPDLEAMLNLA